MELPPFRYHPEPLKSGSVIESYHKCKCCHENTGYIYTGSVYAKEELQNKICPWCIHDGTAHELFEAEFIEFDGIGNYGQWGQIEQSIKEEVAQRTPGFMGWQGEKWWVCCDDAAAFLGPMGKDELIVLGSEVQEELRKDSGMEEADWPSYFASLHKEDSPTAYIFQCLHCKKISGYSDFD